MNLIKDPQQQWQQKHALAKRVLSIPNINDQFLSSMLLLIIPSTITQYPYDDSILQILMSKATAVSDTWAGID